jgi:hypothetical protein
VEEKEVHAEDEARESDEDVEGHVNHAVNTGVNLRQDEDEGDDVEGHVNQAVNARVNARQDEGDDVEGHVNI